MITITIPFAPLPWALLFAALVFAVIPMAVMRRPSYSGMGGGIAWLIYFAWMWPVALVLVLWAGVEFLR